MDNMPQINAAASALPFSIASQAIPNFSIPVPENMTVWPTASRRMQLSIREWEELKPIIQRLYIDEDKKFKEVAMTLQTNYNFTPTKRQFDEKVKKWKLRKNATRAERTLILQNERDGKEVTKTSFRLNPDKLERWKREDKLSGSLGRSDVQKEMERAGSASKIAAQRPPERALSPLREAFEAPVGSPEVDKLPQTIWNWANIVGSPNFSRLQLALKIDDEFPIPPLRLASMDHRYITKDHWGDIIKRPSDDAVEVQRDGSNALVRSSNRHEQRSNGPELFIYQWVLSQVEKPWTPLNEIYPFPTRAKTQRLRNKTITVKRSYVKSTRLQIIESEARVQKMQKIFDPENPGLVAEMDHLADLYWHDGKYIIAENLFRHTALARQNTLGPCAANTLEAYLCIVQLKASQEEYSEAKNLHRDLDSRIQKLFNCHHYLVLRSRSLRAGILSKLNKAEEAQILQREVLQTMLNKFGQTHEKTVRAMLYLAATMKHLHQYAQSEQLLHIAFQIDSQLGGDYGFEKQRNIMELAEVLDAQGRHAESCSLMKDLLSRSVSTLGTEHPTTLNRISWLARYLKMNRQFEESELLSRRNLWRYKHIIDTPDQPTFIATHDLARVLTELSCWTEAGALLENVHRGYSKIFGLDHQHTEMAWKDLIRCYNMQGLYRDPARLVDKRKSVLESECDEKIFDLVRPRKSIQISKAEDDDLDEVEEIRPSKKRRIITCTYNLKAGYD